MRVMNVATIGKLIEAHNANDNEKFRIYAEHIAGAYEDKGDTFGAKLIRDRINGVTSENKVVLE